MKDKWNIMLLNSALHIGGAEEVIAHLAANLDHGHFRVFVCYLKEGGLVAERMIRNDIHVVGVHSAETGSTNYLTSLQLRRLIRRLNIHLVHSHSLHAFIDGSICRLLTPSLRYIHTFHFGNYPKRRFRYRWIEKMLWRIPDQLVVVGQNQKTAIQKTYKIPEYRLSRIYNGVAKKTVQLSNEIRKLSITDDTLIFGCISTLTEQKGLFHLLEAVKILARKKKKFVLLLVGEGHLREPLQHRARLLRIESWVHFLGWVPEAAVSALPRFDVFVQSSLWEAMSMVVLEAMAYGKPLLATRVGENARIIDDGVNGILVPPGNSKALAEGMERLMEDANLRLRLGRAAQAIFEDEFTADRMTENYSNLYKKLLVSKR